MRPHECREHAPGTVTCYNGPHRCRCSDCLRAKRIYDKSGQLAKRRIDATGARRRIQALSAIGWPMHWLDEKLGRKHSYCSKLTKQRWIGPRVSRRIRALYEELWDKRPPHASPRDRYSIRRTRSEAAAKGWAPPMAWDDIDDPSEEPSSPKLTREEELAGQLEDIQMLLETCDTTYQIADRLGIQRESLLARIRRGGIEIPTRVSDNDSEYIYQARPRRSTA